jgi:hypothetical protein
MGDVGIDSGFPLFDITSCTYKPIRFSRGVLFSTYASLISEKNNAVGDEHKQRLEQIIEWAVIILMVFLYICSLKTPLFMYRYQFKRDFFKKDAVAFFVPFN